MAEIYNLNLDFQEFTTKGFMLGHASVVSIPKDFPMTEYIHHCGRASVILDPL